MIRKAVNKDLSEIAKIHKDNFRDHYLGNFSEKLISYFYESFIGLDSFIVSDSESGIQGFILGGGNVELNSRKNLFVNKYPLRYLSEIMMHPRTWYASIVKFADLLKSKLIYRKSGSHPIQSKETFSLLSIAVAKCCQQKGVATEMFKYFESLCPLDSFRLTVHSNNLKAIGFYEKMGMFCFSVSDKNSKGYCKVVRKTK